MTRTESYWLMGISWSVVLAGLGCSRCLLKFMSVAVGLVFYRLILGDGSPIFEALILEAEWSDLSITTED